MKEQTDVLISWSGRPSRHFAEALHEWLPKVIPAIKPWISTQDIDKGKRWSNELQNYLKTAKGCVVCLTPDNLESPWVYWETGAIALVREHSIYPVLIGISPDDIKDGPLRNFQCTYDQKGDAWLLVRSLNGLLDSPEDQMRLKGIFETHWEQLHAAFNTAAEMGIPRVVVTLIKRLETVKTKFEKRLESDSKAETWEPLKQLARDTDTQIGAILDEASCEQRINLHVAELRSKIRGLTQPSTKDGAFERGTGILTAFNKVIKAIKAEYEHTGNG